MKHKIPKLIYSLLVLLLGVFSCKNEDKNLIDDVDDIVLSSSAEVIILKEELVGEEVLSFRWNRGSNKITEYRLEIDLKGNSFSQKAEYILPVDTEPILSFRHEELNNLIEQTWPTLLDKQGEFEVRVCGLDNGEVVLESNVLSLKITPYTEAPLLFDDIWISGDAVSELSADEAYMAYDDNLKKFVWEGKIFAGEGFVFRADLNSNVPVYCKGEDDNSMQLVTDESVPVTDFTVSEDNWYRIEIDTRKMTINISIVEKITDKIAIVGNLNSWDITNAEELTKVSTNIYVYKGYFPEGEFKFTIGVTDQSWNLWHVPMIMPMYNYQPLSDTDCKIVSPDDGVDDKWYISGEEVGDYEITINTGVMKIFIIKQ
jgi:hypothetical protein